MDLLKEEHGTTILETLVVILLLGILVTLTASFFSNLFNNERILRGEALSIAQQEISRVLSEKSETDTLFKNEKGNLQIRRVVYKEEKLNLIEIMVSKSSNDSLILTLKAAYKNGYR